MSLWIRVKRIIKSKFWKWRNSTPPDKSLKENLAKMESYLQEIKKSSLKLGKEKGRLESRIRSLEKTEEDFAREARQALKIGENQQAEMALREKYNISKRKEKIKENIHLLEDRIESLENSKEALKNRIQIFRTKQIELDALQNASEAELRIQEITAGMSEEVFDNVGHAVEESEKRLEEIQAKVEATREILAEKEFSSLPGAFEEGKKIDYEDMDEEEYDKLLKEMKKSLKNDE